MKHSACLLDGNIAVNRTDVVKLTGGFIKKLLVILISVTTISWNSFSMTGPHGGRVEKADNFFIEVKSEGKVLNIYLLDNNSKTMASEGISGNIKLFFPDTTSLNIQLKPIDNNTFTCEVPLGFNVCKVSFLVLGKEVSAIFDTPAPVVIKK